MSPAIEVVLDLQPSVVVLVDGSNVSYASTQGSRPSLKRLQAVRAALDQHGIRSVTFADASLRHLIDDKLEFANLLASNEIVQVPAGSNADDYILQFAQRRQGRGDTVYILTNDTFPIRSARGVVPRITFLTVPWGDSEELLFNPPLESLTEAGEGAEETILEAKEETIVEVASSNVVTAAPTLPAPAPTVQPPAPTEAPPVSSAPTLAAPPDLIAAFLKFLLFLEPLAQEGALIPFTALAGYLHNQFEGDFCQRFGYRKPKDFAEALQGDGYAIMRRPSGPALYLELTQKALDETARIELEVEAKAESAGAVNEPVPELNEDIVARALDLLREEHHFPTEERVGAKLKSLGLKEGSAVRAALDGAVDAGLVRRDRDATRVLYWPASGRWDATDPNDQVDPYPAELWKDFDQALHRLEPNARTEQTRYHLAKHLGEAGVPSIREIPQAQREHMVQLAVGKRMIDPVPTYMGTRLTVPVRG